MADLFDPDPATPAQPAAPAQGAEAGGAPRPLADRLRPERLEDVVGQEHLLGPEGPLAAMLAGGAPSSLILWGPPGVGKTTIARLLARRVDMTFVQVSAIFAGVAELRKVFDAARARRLNGRGTLLFVDEIHRFNKAQQDSFLPHMEDGSIVLVGATTENPSFELNRALLSRAQVLTLRPLGPEALEALLARAEAAAGRALPLDKAGRAALIAMADGDGRALLNMAEQLFALGVRHVGADELSRRLSRRAPLYDKSGDGHYDLISALHKSVRASDPDAALYWLARMLSAGEDPRYVARRVTRMAVEDIGLADPSAVQQCLAAWESYERLGSPEGELALAQAVLHLALAPKSNAAYVAWKAALAAARETGSIPPPKALVNAPTRLMKELGHGEGYVYDHDAEDGFSGQNCFPDGMERRRFYVPVERGFERELARRAAWFEKRRRQRAAERDEE
ncbi:replication-associated recombination protein A [Oceanicella actignis]|uniref:Replication-associated recombination protein A n=1 Tax=Oceanicella actignis TaxID=1189325 RepID=A0A1M7TLC8_9RHOB|nr:replication-associated recombination protein A [Oceanicella actignis]SET69218.1 putative ATPase [Oceanicella actignis]SHN71433.1 putative ATPase [Oceanicella actignis]